MHRANAAKSLSFYTVPPSVIPAERHEKPRKRTTSTRGRGDVAPSPLGSSMRRSGRGRSLGGRPAGRGSRSLEKYMFGSVEGDSGLVRSQSSGRVANEWLQELDAVLGPAPEEAAEEDDEDWQENESSNHSHSMSNLQAIHLSSSGMVLSQQLEEGTDDAQGGQRRYPVLVRLPPVEDPDKAKRRTQLAMGPRPAIPSATRQPHLAAIPTFHHQRDAGMIAPSRENHAARRPVTAEDRTRGLPLADPREREFTRPPSRGKPPTRTVDSLPGTRPTSANSGSKQGGLASLAPERKRGLRRPQSGQPRIPFYGASDRHPPPRHNGTALTMSPDEEMDDMGENLQPVPEMLDSGESSLLSGFVTQRDSQHGGKAGKKRRPRPSDFIESRLPESHLQRRVVELRREVEKKGREVVTARNEAKHHARRAHHMERERATMEEHAMRAEHEVLEAKRRAALLREEVDFLVSHRRKLTNALQVLALEYDVRGLLPEGSEAAAHYFVDAPKPPVTTPAVALRQAGLEPSVAMLRDHQATLEGREPAAATGEKSAEEQEGGNRVWQAANVAEPAAYRALPQAGKKQKQEEQEGHTRAERQGKGQEKPRRHEGGATEATASFREALMVLAIENHRWAGHAQTLERELANSRAAQAASQQELKQHRHTLEQKEGATRRLEHLHESLVDQRRVLLACVGRGDSWMEMQSKLSVSPSHTVDLPPGADADETDDAVASLEHELDFMAAQAQQQRGATASTSAAGDAAVPWTHPHLASEALAWSRPRAAAQAAPSSDPGGSPMPPQSPVASDDGGASPISMARRRETRMGSGVGGVGKSRMASPLAARLMGRDDEVPEQSLDDGSLGNEEIPRVGRSRLLSWASGLMAGWDENDDKNSLEPLSDEDEEEVPKEGADGERKDDEYVGEKHNGSTAFFQPSEQHPATRSTPVPRDTKADARSRAFQDLADSAEKHHEESKQQQQQRQQPRRPSPIRTPPEGTTRGEPIRRGGNSPTVDPSSPWGGHSTRSNASLRTRLLRSGSHPRKRRGSVASSIADMATVQVRGFEEIILQEIHSGDFGGLMQMVRQMRRVMATAALLARVSTLRDITDTLVAEACLVTESERAALFLYDPEKDELWAKATGAAQRVGAAAHPTAARPTRGAAANDDQQETMESDSVALADDDTLEIRFPASRGIAGWVVKNRKPLVVKDAYADPRFNTAVDAATGFKTRNILAVPVLDAHGVSLGVLQTVNKRGIRPYSDIDTVLLGLLAAQTAMVLTHSRTAMEAKSVRSMESYLLETLPQLTRAFHALADREPLPRVPRHQVPDLTLTWVEHVESTLSRMVGSTVARLYVVDRSTGPHRGGYGLSLHAESAAAADQADARQQQQQQQKRQTKDSTAAGAAATGSRGLLSDSSQLPEGKLWWSSRNVSEAKEEGRSLASLDATEYNSSAQAAQSLRITEALGSNQKGGVVGSLQRFRDAARQGGYASEGERATSEGPWRWGVPQGRRCYGRDHSHTSMAGRMAGRGARALQVVDNVDECVWYNPNVDISAKGPVVCVPCTDSEGVTTGVLEIALVKTEQGTLRALQVVGQHVGALLRYATALDVAYPSWANEQMSKATDQSE